MSWINMQESKLAIAMVQMIQNNFEGYTKKQAKKAILDHTVQEMVGHPTDERLKINGISKL